MKNVIYAKRELTRNRGRAISVRETLPEKDCDTSTRKSFVYLVRRVKALPEQVSSPEIRVVKVVDSQARRELFFLRVKGVVYFKKGRFVRRVDYLHTLVVKMFWKTHVLSDDPVTFA